MCNDNDMAKTYQKDHLLSHFDDFFSLASRLKFNNILKKHLRKYYSPHLFIRAVSFNRKISVSVVHNETKGMKIKKVTI